MDRGDSSLTFGYESFALALQLALVPLPQGNRHGKDGGHRGHELHYMPPLP